MTIHTFRFNGYKHQVPLRYTPKVLATLSDKRRSVCNEELGIAYFEAEVLTQTDYYPFGMMMPDRQWSAGAEGYRYGFNGKESDSETGFQDYGFRIYYPAIGKFLSVDPLFKEFPFLTVYQFSSNMPIMAIDLDGLEAKIVITSQYFLNLISEAVNEGKIDEATRLAWTAVHATFPDGRPVATFIEDANGIPGFCVLNEKTCNSILGVSDNIVYNRPRDGWAKGKRDPLEIQQINSEIKLHERKIKQLEARITELKGKALRLEERIQMKTEEMASVKLDPFNSKSRRKLSGSDNVDFRDLRKGWKDGEPGYCIGLALMQLIPIYELYKVNQEIGQLDKEVAHLQTKVDKLKDVIKEDEDNGNSYGK